MDDYQKYIHLSKYARYLDKEKRRETWEETIKRYVDYISKIVYSKRQDKEAEEEIKNIYNGILNLDFVPSMRALMSAGKALDRDNAAAFNCAACAITNPKIFDELFYLLMCGSGVGFSVERQYIIKMPEIAEELYDSDTTIVVPDSKIGWASSLRELISLLYIGKIPKWDLSKIRPAGSKLKVFGGRASGPLPLNRLFEFVVRTFKKAKGRKLNSLECHDIMCKIADTVIVGSVRRCLPENAFIHTKNGLKMIKDIEIGDEVLSEKNNYNKVLAKEETGIKKIVTIKTKNGNFECTPEHRMAVLTNLDGSFEWKEAKELTTDDTLIFSKTPIEGINTEWPKWNYVHPKMSTTCKDITIPELYVGSAWFLGQLHGDGYVMLNKKETGGEISIACSDSIPEQHKKVVEQMKRFGVNINEQNNLKEKCSKPRSSSKQLASYFSKFKKPNKNIEIPDFILKGRIEIRSAYIAGLFDADGHLNGRPISVADSIYYNYLLDVQSLLASLGISSYISIKRKKINKWKQLYALSIRSNYNINKFEELIGKYSVKIKKFGIKKRKLERQTGYIVNKKLLKNSPYKNKFNLQYTFPSSRVYLSWNTFEKVCGERWFLPMPVLAVINNYKEINTYDIQVENSECFIAQGFLTHNSAMISFSNLSDLRMAGAKNGEWWITNPQRALANNSVAYTEKPDLAAFTNEWQNQYVSKSGERGIVNKVALKEKSISCERNYDGEYLLNPLAI